MPCGPARRAHPSRVLTVLTELALPKARTAVRFPIKARQMSSQGAGAQCCLCNGLQAKCIRCACKRQGRLCTSCKAPNCQNSTMQIETLTKILDVPDQGRPESLVSERMYKAFGATLQNSEGGDKHETWYKRWSKIVHFKCQQYDLPGGAIGREFVSLLSEEVSRLASSEVNSERLIVFTVVMLQRDAMVKKGTDVRRMLKRRMDAWRAGQIDELMFEAERCAQQLPKPPKSKQGDEHTVRIFTRLMLRGQVRSAVRWMTERASSGGILNPSTSVGTHGKTVLNVLKEKHPEPREATEKAFLLCEDLPPLVDVDVTAAHVEKVARLIQGGAGPGGTMALHWQDFLLRYGAHSERLRDAVAELARRLANTIVEWDDIRALMASRLIALDKCPGVRPIGVGEVLRRILGKVMALATGMDVEEECMTDQLCSGLKAGLEGAVHAMRELFEENAGTGWGLLLVDARNAFNSINRKAALWNVRVQWPRCSRFLFNTYRGYATLVVHGTPEFVLSKEGVTQGDPLSMMMYAIAVLPLIQALVDRDKWDQNWYADDSACSAELPRLREWFDKLCEMGPDFGYYPEPEKTILVVDSKDKTVADRLFVELGVTVVTGHRFLGGFIGDQEGNDEYVKQKVQKWVQCVESLTKAAESQPQAAHAALTKSLQFEWAYLQRVVPNCADAFVPLRDSINGKFIHAVLGGGISEQEKALLSLPSRMGGMGLRDPVESAEMAYSASKDGTVKIVKAIKGDEEFTVHEHRERIAETHVKLRMEQKEQDQRKLDAALESMDAKKRRTVMRAVDGKTSNWLTVMPVARHQFDLSAVEFRDALAMRYSRPLLRMPANCDGCGGPFDLTHALDCKKGGLVTQRHNEVRDALGDIAALAYKEVVREPVVREADEARGISALVADLGVRGVWQPQTEALFDVRVIDTDAQSYVQRAVSSVLATVEREKKRKYAQASQERHASFSPFVLSVDGLLAREAQFVIKRFAEKAFHQVA